MSTNTLGISLVTGITLTEAGSYLTPLTVTATGTINSAGYDVSSNLFGAGLTDAGNLIGAGIIFRDGGNVSVTASGRINSTNNGVEINNAPGTAVNAGTIIATAGRGVYLNDGGSVANTGTAAAIYGKISGITVRGLSGEITNQGSISGGAGVYLMTGGTVFNSGPAADIHGGKFGVYVSVSPGTIINSGTIGGVSAEAIDLLAGGIVINQGSSASLYSASTGVRIVGASGTVENSATITGTANAIVLGNGGLVQNSGTAGFISGSRGVLFVSAPGGVVNSGTILATSNAGAGIYFEDGGTITNQGAGALIRGGGDALEATRSAVTLYNTGTLTGSSYGADLRAGGTIFNSGTAALISGARYGLRFLGSPGIVENSGAITSTAGPGIYLAAGGTVQNAGSIAGSTLAVAFDGVNASRLIIAPGASFAGTVSGDASASSTLELMRGATAGTISGLGSSFVNFSTISLDGGARWMIQGNSLGLAAGQTIIGLTQLDTIELAGISVLPNGATFGPGGLTLNTGLSTATLQLAGNFSTANFTVASNAGGVQIINDAAACFCAGTRIRTARGQLAIERLKAGDLVQTQAHGAQPVKWIGWRAYDGAFIAGNHLALPVRIRRHALGQNVPSRDLFVSPEHAIYIDGVLIHAWRLINGVTITQAARVTAVNYYHVELAAHEVIFAEDCPAESFRDADCRARFQNAAEYAARYGATPAPPSCLPLLRQGYALEAVLARLRARAGLAAPAAHAGALRGHVDEAGPEIIRGWAQDISAPEAPVALCIFRGGEMIAHVLANLYRPDLRREGLGSGCHGFEVPMPKTGHGRLSVRRAVDGAELPVEKGLRQTG